MVEHFSMIDVFKWINESGIKEPCDIRRINLTTDVNNYYVIHVVMREFSDNISSDVFDYLYDVVYIKFNKLCKIELKSDIFVISSRFNCDCNEN